MEVLTFHLEDFDGPLDLLLHLVGKNKMNLYDINIMELIDQYTAAIASTPVVVINSADHKLSSGVSWFPKEVFGDYVQFANTLDEAYALAASLLERTDLEYNNPPYFKQKYWDRLKDELDAQQQ